MMKICLFKNQIKKAKKIIKSIQHAVSKKYLPINVLEGISERSKLYTEILL